MKRLICLAGMALLSASTAWTQGVIYAAPGRYFIRVLQDPFTELVRFPDVVLAYDATGPSPWVDVTSSTYGGGAKCDGVINDLPSLSRR